MRSLKFVISAACAAALLAGCATPKTPPPQFTVLEPNVSVSLHDVDVRDWAKDDRSVLLQTYHREWYRASLSGGCTDAGDLSRGIGFETQTGDLVDRGSFVVVGRQRCLIVAVDHIAEPPAGSRW